MSQAPAISVIIATYHWSAALRLAIRSVLLQTMQDFEILVVGDRRLIQAGVACAAVATVPAVLARGAADATDQTEEDDAREYSHRSSLRFACAVAVGVFVMRRRR